MSTLRKLKQGKKNYTLVDFPGTEEKVALVILTSDEVVEARLAAEKIIEEKNLTDEDYKEIEFQKQFVYFSLRDKDNRDKRLAENYEDLSETLDNMEIQYLYVQYQFLTTESSPFLSAVSEEQFEQLKKTLEKMSLKDLSGISLVALRNFLLNLA